MQTFEHRARAISRMGLSIATFVACLGFVQSANAQILVEASEDAPFYKLSNLQVTNGLFGEVISFDYTRKREGTGPVYLAGRSDTGIVRITGYSDPINKSGTIRLEDRHSGLRGILSRGHGSGGIEFYFVTGGPPFTWGLTANGKRYLVSNTIRHGTMNTKIAPRKLTKKDRQEAALARKKRLPAEDLPDGYTRGTASTPLVPGAPVLFSRLGEWAAGTVAAKPTAGTVKVKPDDSLVLVKMALEDWIAVSEEVAEQIRSQPHKFEFDFRTLPDGNLILAEGVHPLNDATQLVKGTPLLIEQYSQWVEAHFLSSDNVSVRVLSRRNGKANKIEFIPYAQIAIRDQTLKDLEAPSMHEAFAANVADYERNLPGNGSMQTVGGFNKPSRKDNPAAANSTRPQTQSPAPIRTWKDLTGKFEIKARLKKQEDTNVFLERLDGNIVKVPTEKLSTEDQTYLTELATSSQEKDNPFSNVVESATNQAANATAAAAVDYDSPLVPLSTVKDLRWGAKSVAISPDSKYLLIGRNAASASLCDVKTGQILIDSGRMEHLGNIGVCGFTPDGKHVVLGGSKGVVEVYSFSSEGGMELLTQFAMHTKAVSSLAFSENSRYAITGGEDKAAYYWEVETGRRVATISGFKGKVNATHASAASGTLLATDGEKLVVYDAESSKVIQELALNSSWASGQAAAISPDGRTIAVGNTYDVRLWDLDNYTELPTIKGSEIAWTITFAPDNRHCLTGGNGVVNVWNTSDQSRALSIAVGESFYIKAIATSPAGDLVTCPADHNSVVVLQAR